MTLNVEVGSSNPGSNQNFEKTNYRFVVLAADGLAVDLEVGALDLVVALVALLRHLAADVRDGLGFESGKRHSKAKL